jgi:flagellin
MAQGKRITRASDDAARLAISTKISAQIRGKNQAIRNTNDAVSIVQMAEGGLEESRNMVNRMRQLAVQAASDTVSNSERYMLQMEFQETMKEMDRISGISVLFGHQLLVGNDRKLEFQIDTGATSQSRITLDMNTLDQRPSVIGLDKVRLDDKNMAYKSLDVFDKALDNIGNASATLGAFQQRFYSSMDKLGHDVTNFSAANSRLIDADYAQETANRAVALIKEDVASSVQSQSNGRLKQAVKLIG